jgi:hypothetical protein
MLEMMTVGFEEQLVPYMALRTPWRREMRTDFHKNKLVNADTV